MDPQDDPEARIRQLEQASGADRATELGVSQPGANYGYVPPPPSGSYVPPPFETSSYPPPTPPTAPWSYPPPVDSGGFTPTPGYFGAPIPTPRRTSSGRWMLFIPILIVMMAVAGGVIAYTSSMFNGIGSITTNPGGFNNPTRAKPTETGPPTIPPQGGSFSVAGIGDHKTVACNDSAVSVSGSQNTITITGHCASLSVSGISNEVTVDAADEITASGFNNHVVFKSGSPKVDNSGENTVEQG